MAKVIVDNGRAAGVALTTGEELRAPIIVTTVHPKIVFLQLLDRADLPPDFVDDIERWNTRSGTVKVNFAVDRLPEFTSKLGFDPEVHGGTIVLARSLDEVETAFQDAVKGRGAERPFADICIPSVFDPTLAPSGHHIVSMFTQWVPAEWADKPMHAELEAYADRLVATLEEVAPGFTDSILHRKVVGLRDEHEYGLVGGTSSTGNYHPTSSSTSTPRHLCRLHDADRRFVPGGLGKRTARRRDGYSAMNAVKRIAHDEKRSRFRRSRVGSA